MTRHFVYGNGEASNTRPQSSNHNGLVNQNRQLRPVPYLQSWEYHSQGEDLCRLAPWPESVPRPPNHRVNQPNYEPPNDGDWIDLGADAISAAYRKVEPVPIPSNENGLNAYGLPDQVVCNDPSVVLSNINAEDTGSDSLSTSPSSLVALSTPGTDTTTTTSVLSAEAPAFVPAAAAPAAPTIPAWTNPWDRDPPAIPAWTTPWAQDPLFYEIPVDAFSRAPTPPAPTTRTITGPAGWSIETQRPPPQEDDEKDEEERLMNEFIATWCERSSSHAMLWKSRGTIEGCEGMGVEW